MRLPDDELAALREAGVLRGLRPVEPSAPPLLRLDGREFVSFASNDYLGLSRHPALQEAAHTAIEKFGTGSTASRLICGSLPIHHELEARLAALKKTEAALSFSSGYAAALGTLAALLGKDDTVILDKLSHACLIDGARLSGATLRVYPHNNLSKLQRLLATAREKSKPGARILVVTESVFSMDGDHAPLAAIVSLVEEADALLLVDEAHAVGVLGPNGQGLVEELGLQKRVAFQMGTLGKALGAAGGYLAADRSWIDLLLNKARSFIYSTAPPPAQTAAALAGLNLVASPSGTALRTSLRANLARFSELLGVAASSPIIPIRIGENAAALAASQFLYDKGFLVPAIRYPTVPRNTARLRVTLSAVHTAEQCANLASHLRASGNGN